MSFMKSGRSQLSQGKKSARPKKTAPKREWVSTVNDLSVHKSTPAELSHRHEIHKSHNTAVAQWELKEKSLRRCQKHLGSPAPMDQASLSIIREVFSDQLLLQDVLARSDRAMSVVKDLFGDAPRRHTGHPSVTMAPDCDSDCELPVVQRADPPTQLSVLSHSMMNQQALNELEVSEEDHSEGETAIAGANPRHRADRRKTKTKAAVGRGPPRPRAKPNSRPRGLGDGGPRTPCAPDPAALNATVAVQRVRSQTTQSEGGQGAEPDVQDTQVLNSSGRSDAAPLRQRETRGPHLPETSGLLDGSAVLSLSGSQSSLDLLQAMLGRVEADLDSLGPQEPEREGRPPAEAGHRPPRTQGLTGFSVALVSTLGRLVHLLRQREEEAQREVRERTRLEEVVLDQRGLIDALTAESLALREESAALQVCVQQRTSELEHRLDRVVLALGGLDLLGPPGGSHTHQDPAHPHGTGCGSPSAYVEIQPHATPASVSSAVLLSPPLQRDNPRHSPERAPGRGYVPPRQGARAHPHPDAAPVTPDHGGRVPLSEDAMVAEITRLSRQNERIKAQLTQTRALGSALSRSHDLTATATTSCQSRGSSSSSGSAGQSTTAPHGAGVRRASAGRERERESRQVHLTGGTRLLSPEPAASCASTGGSVEQRLLELNRQSAAARGRLLELIEQQKQSASPVSPSVSPIPPSAFSPHTGGRTPESSVSLPDQERSQGSGGSELQPTGVSAPSLGAEGPDPGRPKADRLGEGEGWFALSSHIHDQRRSREVITGHF